MGQYYKKTDGNTTWFRKDRFGMFIHFGLYSLNAKWEWVKTTHRIPDEKYDAYTEYFSPDLFDAKEWAKKAKAAGMKYAVLTTKHHDGFCLFDSKFTDYKVTNTPFKRDIVKEFVQAFREEGLKVGLYYSLIDWHHKDFPIDVFHPHRDDGEELDKNRDMKKYAQYMRDQVAELLTNYGKIDILWFDFFYPNPTPEYIKNAFAYVKKDAAFYKEHKPETDVKAWMQFNGGKGKEEYESEKLIALVRNLAPDIILNDRAGIPQDIFTPEQVFPTEPLKDANTGELLTWEACHTFSGSWGYARDEHTWKNPQQLIDTLVKTVSVGGNLIMNVGPTGRGNFDSRADAALKVYSDWMKLNGRSIYGCVMADEKFIAPSGTSLTQSEDGKRLYIFLNEYPNNGKLIMPSLAGKVRYAQFLHDASEITFVNDKDEFKFLLPETVIQKITPVIEVFLD